MVLVQATLPSCASTQPTAAWNERAQIRSPTRTTGPTRSASRSTSLAPRGEPSGTSQRSDAVIGSKPAMRGPWPTTRVFLNGDDDAGLRQRQRIAGPLHLPELDAVAGIEGVHGAVDAEDEDAAAGDQRRGRDANAEHFLPLDLAAFERDQLAVARDDGCELAVAAHAGRDLGADIGSPERRGRCRPRPRARCRRSPPASARCR